MAYETFPWDDVGEYWTLEVIDLCDTLEVGFEAGYQHSRPRNTRTLKEFRVDFHHLDEFQWLALLTFFRTVRGKATAFYWQYPIGMAGFPGGFGGISGTSEDFTGFAATEVTVGFGEGPVFLVRFTHDNLDSKRLFRGWWSSQIKMRMV